MVHQPSGGFQGQATDIEIHAREILTLRGRLNQIYVEHSWPRSRRATHRDRAARASEFFPVRLASAAAPKIPPLTGQIPKIEPDPRRASTSGPVFGTARVRDGIPGPPGHNPARSLSSVRVSRRPGSCDAARRRSSRPKRSSRAAAGMGLS